METEENMENEGTEGTEAASIEIDIDADLDNPLLPSSGSVEDKFADVKPEHLGIRNFRSHPDFENFFRFVNEYNLRREAYLTLDKVLVAMGSKRKKAAKSPKRAKKH